MLTGGRRYKVLEIRGIPVFISMSWLAVVAFYVYAEYVAFTIQPRGGQLPMSGSAGLGYAVLSAILFFGGVLLHEAAHAVVSRAFDLPVAGITLVFWGGATETRSNGRGPLAEFLIAAAGPATTLALAGVFAAAALVFSEGMLHEILHDLAGLNLLFAALNAVPGFPLDGGRVLLATTWGITKDRRTALRVAGYGGILVGAGFLAGAFALGAGGNLGFAIFAGYIGAILIGTGRAMSGRIALRDRLVTGTVADAMREPPATVPAEMTLSDALDHVLRANPDQSFPVVDVEGRVIGTVSMESARRIGGRDPLRPVSDATRSLNQTPVLRPEDSLDDALEWLGGKDGMVLRDGLLLGALGPLDVERWYRRRYEGAGDDEPAAPVGAGSPPGVPPRPDL